VPASDKLVSLFEPHTAIIRRGKAAPRETKFGHKVWLDEVEGGIVSDYRILPGNPPDPDQFPDSLHHHQKTFHHPPEVAAADRGIHSPKNEQAAQKAGVSKICLPQPGHKSRSASNMNPTLGFAWSSASGPVSKDASVSSSVRGSSTAVWTRATPDLKNGSAGAVSSTTWS
jgi:IS5 family transposase